MIIRTRVRHALIYDTLFEAMSRDTGTHIEVSKHRINIDFHRICFALFALLLYSLLHYLASQYLLVMHYESSPEDLYS